jgi:hypothetical protein
LSSLGAIFPTFALSRYSAVVACGKPRSTCGKGRDGLGKVCGTIGERAQIKIRIKNYGDYVTIYGDPIP